MAKKSYRVHLAVGDENIDPTQGREVITETHRSAALLAYQVSSFGHPCRSSFRKGETVTAWVWDDAGPKHATGMPMCVHKIELKAKQPVAAE